MKLLRHSTALAATLAIAAALPGAMAAPRDAPPSAAQVEALLDAMDLERTQQDMLDQMSASTDAMLVAGLGEDPRPEDIARLQRISAEQQAVMSEFMQSDHTRKAYRTALRQTMTASEIEAMTAFYRSPAGRSAMEKMPAVMAVVMRELQPAIAEIMARTRAELESSTAREGEAPAG